MSKNRQSQPLVILRPRKCSNCPNEITTKRKDAIYCNHRCRSRAGLLRRNAKLAEMGLSEPSKPLEKLECPCGKSFDQKRHWQKYCSPQCGARNRRQRLIEQKAIELIELGFYSSPGGNSSQVLGILLKENPVQEGFEKKEM